MSNLALLEFSHMSSIFFFFGWFRLDFLDKES